LNGRCRGDGTDVVSPHPQPGDALLVRLGASGNVFIDGIAQLGAEGY